MNKKNIILLLFILLNPMPAYAQVGTLTPPPAANVNLTEIITRFINFALTSGVVVFLFVFVWGCINWITSEGDKSHLAQARAKITTAAIGLIILGSSYAIFLLVKTLTYSSP